MTRATDALFPPEPEPTALVPVAPVADGFAVLVERLAANPAVDVDKLERIIAMQERILAHGAKAAFDAAFSRMQAELPTVAEKGKTDKGRYAQLEDIVETIRPILARHRFSISHRTEWLDGGRVKVVGILAHEAGHEKCSEFQTPPDQSGSKNGIQALGSALSYGRRYTTLDLLNIVSRYQDDDGQSAGKPKADVPDEPAGFQDWADNMTAACDSGTKAMVEAWNASPKPLTEYAQKYRQSLTAGWKQRAKAADKAVPRG